MTRVSKLAAVAVLLGGVAAAGLAVAQDAPAGEGGSAAPTAPVGQNGWGGPDAMGQGPGGGPGPFGPMGRMGHGGPIDFDAIDTDGNDSLSRAELVARATERLSPADSNGDGVIDRAELVAFFPAPRGGGLMGVFARNPAEDMAERVLALLGATEAGQVEVGALADARVNLLLAFLDTDHDAAISRAEAEAQPLRQRRGSRHEHYHHHDDDDDDRDGWRGERRGMMQMPGDAAREPSQN
jgi:hypothetical protein